MSCYSIATREQRCRRYLRRVGLELHKCRIRDKWADTYGMYTIVKANTDPADYQYDCDLDDVETFIKDVVWPELLERSRCGF